MTFYFLNIKILNGNFVRKFFYLLIPFLISLQCSKIDPDKKIIAILSLNSQTKISYSKSSYEWIRGVQIQEEKPNILRLNPANNDSNFQYTVTPNFPQGIILDKQTGIISGRPELAVIPKKYTVQVSNNSETQFILLDITVYGYLPLKTYQSTCSNNTGTTISCSQTGQDADLQMGREADFNRPEAYSDYPNDYVTKDNATGLIWKTCPDGQSGSNCSDGSSNLVDWDSAQSLCKQLDSVNSNNGFAGLKNWRTPTREELISMATSIGSGISVSSTYFPNSNWMAWTSMEINTLNAFRSSSSLIGSITKATASPVRCVTGKYYPDSAFKDNGDGTITDYSTKLVWQKCAIGQIGDSCESSATGMNRNNALNACNSLSLANKIWRLPNYTELLSILKANQISQAIDSQFFPNNPTNSFWSSTNYPLSGIAANNVNFSSGSSSNVIKTGTTVYTRCVANMN